jgi:hypothetical protein
MRPRRAYSPPWSGGWPALAAVPVLALGMAAWAQNIRIPDLRDPSPPPIVAPAPKPGEPCNACGVIRSIKEITVGSSFNVPQQYSGEPGASGLSGTVPVGAVISIPFGPGSDQPYVGGVGTPEMRKRFSETAYEITIRLDNGGYTMVQRRDGLAYHVGDRVKVQGTQLELLAP